MKTVPPGGMAGFSGMTNASKYILQQGMGSVRRTVRKARSKVRSATKRKRSAAKKSSGRKLKFGSPAWRKKYLKK